MKKFLSSLVLAAFLMVPTAAMAGTWQIDATHSSVGFKVRHFFSQVSGGFTEFSGTIKFDPAQPDQASVEVVIAAASVDTNNEKRDGHLQSEDFFWVEEHPEITFKSTKVSETKDGLEVDGMLSIRGMEKATTLMVEFHGAGPDGWGGTRSGFSASTKIDRKEFGVMWNKALDQGGAVLGDEVTISLEIEAVLDSEESGE